MKKYTPFFALGGLVLSAYLLTAFVVRSLNIFAYSTEQRGLMVALFLGEIVICIFAGRK